MIVRLLILTAATLAFMCLLPSASPLAQACCPAARSGQPIVNADQTVIIIWDAAKKVQHFIRKASFNSAADDFGFLVPTPSQPELEESGNEAFPYLQKLTEPEIKTMLPPSRGLGCTCSKSEKRSPEAEKDAVKVLVDKEVAGFQAVVLETKSAAALVDWLKKNGYAYSPEIKAWAKPYVEGGWKITALKVVKKAKEDSVGNRVTAGALRISFKTERPLFPYREPDPKSFAETLNAKRRLLRIYFLAEARYQGNLTEALAWSGKAAWAGTLPPEDRSKVLELLKLPETTGPANWWLTEFEDNWAYQSAPADVYFSRSANQDTLKRRPIIRYVLWPLDVMVCMLVLVVGIPLWWHFRRKAGTSRP